MRDTKVDMLHGPLAGKLFWFALPIAASSMLQQLFNAADTAVVGKFADVAALAAVGTNGEIVAFIVSLSAGLAVGTNVLLGMGYSLRPALMTMLGICLFRIVWVETVFRQVRTLPCLFIVFPITWAITLVLIWGTFRFVAWDKLKGNEGSAA